MNRAGTGRVFNTLALAMVGLTVMACLCYSTLFFVPDLAGPFAGRPSWAQLLPTSTPTVGSLLPPTWTPEATPTPQDTATPFIVSTPEPTEDRPTITPAPTRTRAPTPGPSVTPSPTRSKYAFTHEVTLQPSPINPCGASYILGTITDLEGKPVTAANMLIHVEGDADIDTGGGLHPGEQFRGRRVEGRSPFTGLGFGPSAWSVVINQAGTSAGTWLVWLVRNGQASERVEVRLQGECSFSTAVIRFQQNH
jgi:hypothetical protein